MYCRRTASENPLVVLYGKSSIQQVKWCSHTKRLRCGSVVKHCHLWQIFSAPILLRSGLVNNTLGLLTIILFCHANTLLNSNQSTDFVASSSSFADIFSYCEESFLAILMYSLNASRWDSIRPFCEFCNIHRLSSLLFVVTTRVNYRLAIIMVRKYSFTPILLTEITPSVSHEQWHFRISELKFWSILTCFLDFNSLTHLSLVVIAVLRKIYWGYSSIPSTAFWLAHANLFCILSPAFT